MSADLLIPVAALGPAAAATVWLVTSPFRRLQRLLGGLLALGSVAAAWAVFWLAYRGEPPDWAGLTPSLLTASVVAFAATAVLLGVPRADALAPRGAAPAVVGLGVGVGAIVLAAFSESLVSVAVLLPIPTLAAAGASLSGAERPDARGLIGLASADVLGLIGLAWLIAEGGSTLVTRVGMVPGSALILAAAAVKIGAIPWLGTWRLASTTGPGGPVSLVLRAQGVVLLVVVGVIVGGGAVVTPLVWGAGAAALATGAAALWARASSGVAAAVAGVGAALLFLALGLGGTVGVRALLLLFPPFLLAAGVTAMLLERRAVEEDARPWWRWLGGAAMAVGAASLLGLPPFGEFPGAWLALSLAWGRGEAFPYLPAMAAAVMGMGLGAMGAVGLPRGTSPRPASVVIGTGAAAVLLYMGAQPVRLAAGWLVRLEAELGLPEILPTSGAPSLPPVAGWDLLWAGLPALVLVGGILIAGRGLRDADRPFTALLSVRRLRVPPWGRPAARWLRRAVRRVRSAVETAGAAGAGLAAFLFLEAIAIAAAAWVVVRGIAMGFL